MTVAAKAPSKSYTEDGVTLNFAVPFRYLDPTHLEVKRVLSSGAVVNLASGADWTATAGETDTGGTLTLVASVAGAQLRIRRITPRAQQAGYVTYDNFPAQTHEAALDRAMLIDQEQDVARDQLGARALLVPEGETAALLPSINALKGKFLAFDAAGNPVAAEGTGADSGFRADAAASDGAALVGAIQSGTGAVARTVQDKLRDLHSIRDFGGVGGGVINDSGADAAMRAAVKAAGGGVMVYPAISGGYKIGTRARSPGILIEEADFPAFFGEEPPGLLRVYTRNNGAGGTGESGITSFMVNGTGNMVPFSTIGGTDSVALSAVVYSGEDAPNPVCAVNIISRYAGLPPGINWGLEIDMNNESPTSYSAGDPRGGQGIVLNTGSTYSPDTGIVIQRGTGEGTGPGWKQGIGIKGARDVGILVQAMSSATAPGMSPAATGTVSALVVNVGGDAFNRFVLTESGQMFWSSGASAADVNLSRGGAGSLNCSGVFGATQYWVGANAVVGSRRTGWTAPTGTLSRATFDQSTVTLPQLAQRVAALITDLHGQAGGHGLIGN